MKDFGVGVIVKAIIESQRADGGWKFWSKESHPAYSVYALECLVWVGALGREQLADMLRKEGIT